MDEPVTDTVRGILDGHIVLSRELAHANHYPSIDVLQSISRLAPKVSGTASYQGAGIIRKYMADYARVEDFINAGAYRSGSNPAVDNAITMHNPIENFLIQGVNETSSLEDTLNGVAELSGIDIPAEEMTDNNSNIVSVSSHTRKEKTLQEEENVSGAQETAMALNSVAALFSSMPGMNILDDN